MVRPTKRPEDRVLRGHFTYRPDQEAKVKALQEARQLSRMFQAAIDAYNG